MKERTYVFVGKVKELLAEIKEQRRFDHFTDHEFDFSPLPTTDVDEEIELVNIRLWKDKFAIEHDLPFSEQLEEEERKYTELEDDEMPRINFEPEVLWK